MISKGFGFIDATPEHSSRFQKGVAQLRTMLEANGDSLERIGKKAGIDNFETLLRLPIVSTRSAHEFLAMSRQNIQRLANDETLDFGVRIDGKFYFSINELVSFKETPRPSGVTRS